MPWRRSSPLSACSRSARTAASPVGSTRVADAALGDGADAVLLLNNDATVEPGFLEPLVDAACAEGVGPPARRSSTAPPVASGTRGRATTPGAATRVGTPGTATRRSRRRPLRTRPSGPAAARCWFPVQRSKRSALSTRRSSRTPRTSTGRCAPGGPGCGSWSSRRASSTIACPPSTGGAASPDSLYYALRNGLTVAERNAAEGRLGTLRRRAAAAAAFSVQALRSPRRVDGLRAVGDGLRDARRGRLGARGA